MSICRITALSPHRINCISLVVFALLSASAPAASSQKPAADSAKKTAPETSLPILPTRHTRFTTDEGTWMSVDVSPDGKTIVFDLVGDLYTVPITGGTATRIT